MQHWQSVAGAILFSLSLTGCDESLPPRVEPEDVLVASVDNLAGTVTFQIGATEPDGSNGAFFLQLRNTYDEVLQDSALVRGEIDVRLRDHPEYRTVVVADNRHLLNSWIIRARIATLGPDSTANFLRQWDHRTAGGAPFWQFASFTVGYTPMGEKFYLSDSVYCVASARIQIFKPAHPERTAEKTFALRYRIFVIDTPGIAAPAKECDR